MFSLKFTHSTAKIVIIFKIQYKHKNTRRGTFFSFSFTSTRARTHTHTHTHCLFIFISLSLFFSHFPYFSVSLTHPHSSFTLLLLKQVFWPGVNRTKFCFSSFAVKCVLPVEKLFLL